MNKNVNKDNEFIFVTRKKLNLLINKIGEMIKDKENDEKLNLQNKCEEYTKINAKLVNEIEILNCKSDHEEILNKL